MHYISLYFSIGAYNYLSGVNSLSTDGHTLMSVKSPWGMKYEGGVNFDPHAETKSDMDSNIDSASVTTTSTPLSLDDMNDNLIF